MSESRENLRKVAAGVACLAEREAVIAVEPETISKNGVCPKNQRSRGNFSRTIGFVLWVVGITLLSSCSSPEKDGIKAAKEWCNCLDDVYGSYIKKFGSYSFKTRIEARDKLNEDVNKCIEMAEEYRNKLKSKYLTNKENEEKFQYAYDAHKKNKDEGFRAYQDRINTLIQTIIPPKPDLERLKRDMIGREVHGITPGVGQTWWMPIRAVEKVELINITDNGDEYLLNINLYMPPVSGFSGGRPFAGNVTARYRLAHYDDWTIYSIDFPNR